MENELIIKVTKEKDTWKVVGYIVENGEITIKNTFETPVRDEFISVAKDMFAKFVVDIVPRK